MKILLTGGAGFIGSHLTKELLEQGHAVICLDNLDTYYDPKIKRQNIRQFSADPNYLFIEGDIRDRTLLDALFRLYGCDTVVHLAARAGVRPSVENPALYFDVNVNGTLSILEAMRQAGVRRMVMASSSSVYGDAERVPFTESDACDRPLSPYAASKRSAELLAHTYHHLYGFDISCLRFFTVYGPGQRPEMAISQFTERVLNGLPITLFGDGTTARDYTYIDDITHGILKAIDHLNGYAVLNIGGSDPISLRDLVSLIEKATGETALIDWQPMQPGDVERTYADVSLARKQIGYMPSVRIDEGILKFVNWYKLKHELVTA
ncbi:GDP-mannose 4,6-dehydratase [Nibrella saemangeumensis]|uniref:GDP-mannose 4,6-dehydratase n=1 Tax=Nibrella saemangeumensis TaxID=1084526 RepID=A0ABP8NEY2_9BACT